MPTVSPTHQRTKIKRKKLAKRSGAIVMFLLVVILHRKGGENIQLVQHVDLGHTANSGREMPENRISQSVESEQIQSAQPESVITPTTRPSSTLSNDGQVDFADRQTTQEDPSQKRKEREREREMPSTRLL